MVELCIELLDQMGPLSCLCRRANLLAGLSAEVLWPGFLIGLGGEAEMIPQQ